MTAALKRRILGSVTNNRPLEFKCRLQPLDRKRMKIIVLKPQRTEFYEQSE